MVTRMVAIFAASCIATTAVDLTTLEFGLLVETGADTGTLWHSRSIGDLPQEVAVRDWINLYQVLTERCHATQTAQGSNAIRVITNAGGVYEYTNSLAGITNSAGGPFFNWMTGPATNTTTNAVLDFWRRTDVIATVTNPAGFTYGADPPKFVNVYWEQGTNRFLWGPARSVSALGLTTDAVDFNQAYTHWKRLTDVWKFIDVGSLSIPSLTGGYVGGNRDLYWQADADIYTNPVNGGILVDFGPVYGGAHNRFAYNTTAADDRVKFVTGLAPHAFAFIPSTNDLISPGPAGVFFRVTADLCISVSYRSIRGHGGGGWADIGDGWDGGTTGRVIAAGLITNLWRDASDSRWITKTNMLLRYPPMMIPDISGDFHGAGLPVPLSYSRMPAQIICDWINRQTRMDIYGGNSYTYGFREPLIIQYADDTLAVAGAFTGLTANLNESFNPFPMLNETGLFTRLGIGSIGVGTLGADAYYSFQSSNTYKTAAQNDGNRAFMWELTNSWFTTGDVGEVAHTLNEMRWTTTRRASWSGLGSDNQFQWTGTGATWAIAKSAAEVAAPIEGGQDSPPHIATVGSVNAATVYTARARSSRLAARLTGFFKDRTNTVDFYTQATNTDWLISITAASNRFDPQGWTVSNRLVVTETISGLYGVGAVTSAFVGTTGFPPVWCVEPTIGHDTAAGFEINADAQILKWTFQDGPFP